MAKRYTRINWQNKPNTATPISAENLNKMDKGIKDCDDAIGDLALLNTNNKTDLVSAVNELNNNLVKLRLTRTTITSQSDLDNYLDGLHDNLSGENIWYRAVFNVNVAGLSLPGGTYYLEGFRANATFGYQKMELFSTSAGIILKYRSRGVSGWAAWVDK